MLVVVVVRFSSFLYASNSKYTWDGVWTNRQRRDEKEFRMKDSNEKAHRRKWTEETVAVLLFTHKIWVKTILEVTHERRLDQSRIRHVS